MRRRGDRSDAERDELLEMLRDPKTFIAEDLDDLLAVLKHLDQMRANEETAASDDT